jgi:hypothetical protein
MTDLLVPATPEGRIEFLRNQVARLLDERADAESRAGALKAELYAVQAELGAVGIVTFGAAGVRELWLKYTALVDATNAERQARADAVQAERAQPDEQTGAWSYTCSCHPAYRWRRYSSSAIRATDSVTGAPLMDGAEVNPMPAAFFSRGELYRCHPAAERAQDGRICDDRPQD